MFPVIRVLIMFDHEKIIKIIKLLKQATGSMTVPLIDTIIEEYGKDPFLILIGCLLSLRAKDITTVYVCRTLFAVAKSPQALCALDRTHLEKIVFKTGFYKNKAAVLQEASKTLLEKFDGKVPQTQEALRSIKGIGPKTANLVLGLAFDQPAICVDTHVHRISNRLGLISTKTVEETGVALQKVLPKRYWTVWNKLLVMWGQNVCVPISPKCSMCPIKTECKRRGVTRSR